MPRHGLYMLLGSCKGFYKSKFLWVGVIGPTPNPLIGISNDLPWGGYGFFLELHIWHLAYSIPTV